MIGDFIISLGGNNQSMKDKTVNGRCSAAPGAGTTHTCGSPSQ